MKMETVIRSPQDGVIKKLAHKEGVSLFENIAIFFFFFLSVRLSNCFDRIFARLELFLSYLKRSLAKRSHHNGIMKAFDLRKIL